MKKNNFINPFIVNNNTKEEMKKTKIDKYESTKQKPGDVDHSGKEINPKKGK